MPVERPRVLISGASVAGPVLAYWLHRFGFRPTVIERVAELRVGGGGHAVDLFGPVVELMDWMGVLPEVEQARTQTEVIALVRPGRRPVEVPAEMVSEGVSERHIEIMRGDLAQIVYEATRGQVEYVFDDSIATVHDDGSRGRGDVRARGPSNLRPAGRSRRVAFDHPQAGLRSRGVVPAVPRRLPRGVHGAQLSPS